MKRRRVVLALGVSVLAACNLLLGNENGTSSTSPLDGGGTGSSSSGNGSSSSTSSGGGSDAAVTDAAVTGADAAGTSTSGGPLGCVCQQTGAFCTPCELTATPVSQSTDPTLVELAASDTHLWAIDKDLAQPRLRQFTLDPAGAVIGEVDLPDNVLPSLGGALYAGVPFLRPADDVFFNVQNNHGSPNALVCGVGVEAEEFCKSVVQLPHAVIPAANGILAVVSRDSNALIVHVDGQSRVTSLPLFTVTDASTVIMAASSNTVFWSIPNETGATVYRRAYPGAGLITNFDLEVAPEFMAANDETLFVAPCVQGPLCSVTWPAGSTVTTRIDVDGDAGAGPIEALYVDNGDLYFQRDSRVHRCFAPACVPATIGDGALLALTRNSHHLYVQVGPTLLRTKRSSLRPSP